MYTYIYIHVYMCMGLNIYIYKIHTYIHTYIPTYMHACMHTYIHTYIQGLLVILHVSWLTPWFSCSSPPINLLRSLESRKQESPLVFLSQTFWVRETCGGFSGIFPYKSSIYRGTPIYGNHHTGLEFSKIN